MRYVAIEKAKDNMVLAMPIYDSINRVLLATGTIMTRDYIRKLKARGLPGFYVEDELAKVPDHGLRQNTQEKQGKNR